MLHVLEELVICWTPPIPLQDSQRLMDLHFQFIQVRVGHASSCEWPFLLVGEDSSVVLKLKLYSLMIPPCLMWCIWKEINIWSFEDWERTVAELKAFFLLLRNTRSKFYQNKFSLVDPTYNTYFQIRPQPHQFSIFKFFKIQNPSQNFTKPTQTLFKIIS